MEQLFAGVNIPAERNKKRKFANDFNISKEFHRSVTNEKTCRCTSGTLITKFLRPIRKLIRHPVGGGARLFRLMRLTLDEKLRVHECIDKLYKKTKPKTRALLRCRRFVIQKRI